MVAARLGPDPAADAVGRLEHHDVAVAQVPGRREARDAPADHDHVVQLGHAATVAHAARPRDRYRERAISSFMTSLAPA